MYNSAIGNAIPIPKPWSWCKRPSASATIRFWTGEAYGSDALSPLIWVGAHTEKIRLGTSVVQLSARTPACAAMTAMTIDHLSGGRFIMGIGVSGPQIVEGWYGQTFRRPLERTREWVDIFRQVVAREAPVQLQGNSFRLPYDGEGSMGLGKPLKSITHPLRKKIPVFIGAEGPKNVAQTVAIADGWFPLYMSPYNWNIYGDLLANLPPDFEVVMPSISINISDDIAQALMATKYTLALYIGGMGARDMNFHKDLVTRMGLRRCGARNPRSLSGRAQRGGGGRSARSAGR